ncbi:MAG TPA: glycosyltransferase family 39 protein [Candidatus Limnocylindrales bacterium]|nr:glycosyltransferase family 39 protein [Candidatus Limnocylindrales bacterium]
MTTALRPDGGFDADPSGALRPFDPMPVSILRATVSRRALAVSWTLVAQIGVAGLAAALYLVNLTVSGFANTYYSAAALSASQSWSAWFFGSIDASNFITVDKPPLATMVMGLSVRLFGLSSWSVLLPEALMGVGTVLVLMAIVRRTMGSPAAIIAGLVAALTPAAVLIFRYNNPDALLTLLLVGSAYAFVRSLERGSLRWVALAAILVGLAFNTKYLQGWLVLPAFAAVWAIAAPGGVRHRILGLAVALAATIVASGWWILVMELLPVSARPFVGGSTNGTAIDLVLGYDGLGRIFGGSGGPGGGGAGAGGFSGTPGLFRLFNAQLGGQGAWFLPLAGLGLGVGLWARRHAPRTDLRRAAYLMWGLWLAIHVVVFSFMSGVIHSYYVVVMAPAIGALVGGGVVELWAMRARAPHRPWAGILLAGGLAATAAIAWLLLGRTPDFVPGLAVGVVAVTGAAALVIALPARVVARPIQLAAIALGFAVLLAGPATYALDTMQTAYSSGDPAAGPQAVGQGGNGAGFGGPGGPGGQLPSGFTPGGAPGGATGGANGGLPGGTGAGGAFGGSGDQAVNSSLTAYLVANRGTASWIVAVTSANQAGSIELATGEPVMAMGGFTGSDPAPTLEQFQAFVASGQLRFVIVGGQDGGPGGGTDSTARTAWIQANCRAVTSVSSSLYDCAGLTTGG